MSTPISPLPKNKFDIPAAEAMVAMGFPAVEPWLPELMEWMQDINWPVAKVLQPFLSTIGAPLAPYVRHVLETNDDIWKYWVVDCIVAKSAELKRIFWSDLQRMASFPTSGERTEEVDVLAREIIGEKSTFVAVDVQYSEHLAAAAGVVFGDWAAPRAAQELTQLISEPAPYVPGEFWRRELPCIEALLRTSGIFPTIIVIDGYVWLDASGRPGLGAHLFAALNGAVPVIGVAKTAFLGSPHAHPVQRGTSQRPLYVTAQGIAAAEAASAIQQMHGANRIPTLLKRVDRLCRETLPVLK
jgi:deoxyribonuclease V